jgi:predicted transcriptional regulator
MMKKPKKETDMEMVTTTIAFDRETYRRLRHRAVDEDSDVRALVRRAVDEYLKKHGSER